MLLTFARDTFAHKIIQGSKIHTIRVDYNRRWVEGRRIDFWRGNPRNIRMKPFKFGVATCDKVVEIMLDLSSSNSMKWVMKIDGVRTEAWESGLSPFTLLAVQDGFTDAYEMRQFFPEKFNGRLIYWRGFQPFISLKRCQRTPDLRCSRHGNLLISTANFIGKNESSYLVKDLTAIFEFEVINPKDELEQKGEILTLSMFGEYCPPQSLRGYQLEELLSYPSNYRVKTIIDKGQPIRMVK